MASFNKCIIAGNLGRDPELKMTQGGTPLLRFSLAVTKIWKDKSGEKKEKTTWINCTIWGKMAEVGEKIMRKGSSVLVEGELDINEYTDKDGVKKTSPQIVVSFFTLLGGKTQAGNEETRTKGSNVTVINDEDDIPF